MTRAEQGGMRANQGVLDRAADALRLSRFALERASTGLLAFATPNASVGRDIERCREVVRLIDAVLVDLPPEPPLTPEREAQVREVIGRVLDTFDA